MLENIQKDKKIKVVGTKQDKEGYYIIINATVRVKETWRTHPYTAKNTAAKCKRWVRIWQFALNMVIC